MRGRCLPAAGDRIPRLRRRGSRTEELQRGGAALQAIAERRGAWVAGRRRRPPGPLDRGDGRRGSPNRLSLPAERQSGARAEIRLQAGLDGPDGRPGSRAAGNGSAVRSGRRLQRDPGGDRLATTPMPGRTMRSTCSRPGGNGARWSISALPTRCGRWMRHRGATPTGTTSAAPGRATGGIRIDHFLLSPGAADRLHDCTIDREPRAKEKASDHTPVGAVPARGGRLNRMAPA